MKAAKAFTWLCIGLVFFPILFINPIRKTVSRGRKTAKTSR